MVRILVVVKKMFRWLTNVFVYNHIYHPCIAEFIFEMQYKPFVNLYKLVEEINDHQSALRFS